MFRYRNVIYLGVRIVPNIKDVKAGDGNSELRPQRGNAARVW